VVSVVTWGTVIWFVAFVVMLPLRGRLDHAGHPDWFWTSLAGWTLGLVGIAVARAQRSARAQGSTGQPVRQSAEPTAGKPEPATHDNGAQGRNDRSAG
jgi:hypothetical protein